MVKKEIKIKERKVVYRVSGKGKPVMLIHGFGEKSEVWNNQVEFLKEQYRIIIPDLPGSGESELQDDMSMEGMADTLQAILTAEDIAKSILIGHSMGGYILLAFAEKYFSSLEAFGLFHSTAFADSEEKKATRRKGIEFINEHGAFTFLENTTPNLFSPLTKDKRPEIIEEQIQTLHGFLPKALVSYYEAMINRPDRTGILRNSTIPVLFIAGKYDNAVPLQDILKQCHLPSLSYIHILENSGHMGMLEENDKANQILKNFLDKTTFT
jgi:pimeloyl-ACP methyl ester carboxylesterase